jgi:hypothetical protein
MLINENSKEIELICRKLPNQDLYRVIAKLKNKETKLNKNKRV